MVRDGPDGGPTDMFAVDCAQCGARYLLSVHSVAAQHTLKPGVLLVELICHGGHRLTVVTGRAAWTGAAWMEAADGGRAPEVADLPGDPDAGDGVAGVPDRVPRLWPWVYAGRAEPRLGRLRGRLLRFLERQAQLNRRYVHELHR